MMIIDCHAHIIVPEILREAAPAETWRPRVVWEDGRQFVDYKGKRINSATREFVLPDQIIKEMDRSKISGVLLCPWVSLIRSEAKPEESLSACQVQNDALVAIQNKYPRRIAGLGLVPLQDIALSIKELERLKKAGLKGIEIGTQVNGIYPGDVRFLPFWEACEALGVLVFIHPVEGGGREELRDFYMWNVIGNPIETTIAASHLILSGVLESYPRLKIMLAHGGGALPYLYGRLNRGYKMRPEINKVIKRPPVEYIRQFYFDTLTHDSEILVSLVKFAGADHVLLGSDYPFDMGNDEPVDFVRRTAVTPDAERLILGDNAARLLSWNN